MLSEKSTGSFICADAEKENSIIDADNTVIDFV
jgi:hypothetical protein